MEKTELKIYKEIAELRWQIILQMLHRMNKDTVKYHIEQDEDGGLKHFTNVGDTEKWDYMGIMYKQEQHLLKFLEYLIDDKRDKFK